MDTGIHVDDRRGTEVISSRPAAPMQTIAPTTQLSKTAISWVVRVWSTAWASLLRMGGSRQPCVDGALHAAQLRFQQLFDATGDALFLCNQQGLILDCNGAAAAQCGQARDAMVGLAFAGLLSRAELHDQDQAPARPGESMLYCGSRGWQRVRIRLTPLPSGEAMQRLVHVEPVQQHQRDAERLHALANFDSLTGLPNRALFRDRLEQAMSRATRSGQAMALMFLDLDRFKLINDSLGHDVGDRLLVHVAQQLTQSLRSVDSILRGTGDEHSTLSRLGGDEFTVIAEGVCDAENASVVARRLLEALAVPFMAGEQEIVIGASIGVSLYPADNVDLDSLIRHTDMAMYRSKSLGRGVFTFFSDDLNDAVTSRLSLEGSLRHAVERQEFLLHYQPKVDLRTGDVTGTEALLRWHCPSKGMVRPDQFITVLEDTGLIVQAGAWVIRAACAEMARWDRMGLQPIRMAVNMSARQFRHQQLAALIEDTLRENDIEPARLEIELTESLLMEDNEESRNMFANFSRIGVRLAIDDFGTGHSSLAYLKRFNIDTLKIDRSFVSELPDNADDVAIAKAVIALGHSMRMSIVAEGVETQRQADFLRELGCDQMQGYLLSRPLPGADMAKWLHEHERRRQSERLTIGRAHRGALKQLSLATED